jgi:hypothetical protein
LRITRPRSRPQPDGTAPVLGRQHDVVGRELIEQRAEPPAVALDGVHRGIARLVGQAEADQIGDDQPQPHLCRLQLGDDLAPQETPARVAVQHHHR